MKAALRFLATIALATPTHAAIAEPTGDAQAIALEVTLLKCNRQLDSDELAQLSGPSDAVAAMVAELDSEGYLEHVIRMRMTTVEDQEASSQIGEAVWVTAGRSQTPRGPQRSYQRENVGTIVKATTRVSGEAVLVEFEIENSQLRRIESEEDSTPPGSETLTAQGTWRIPHGHTVMGRGFQDASDAGSSGLIVLTSARLLESPLRETVPEKRQVKIFSLQHSPAKEGAKVVEELVADDHSGQIRVAVHPSTNSLIIAAHDEDALATIEAVLRRLDREAAPPEAESATPGPSSEKSANRESAYRDMDKGELQARLKEIQKSLLAAEAELERVQTVAANATRAYQTAQGEEKAEALLRMIEAQAMTRAPSNQFRNSKRDLAAAKDAYISLLIAE